MTCFICVDNNFGLSFNKRRLSRDKKVLLDMISIGRKIHMSFYSRELFKSLDLEKFIDYTYKENYFMEVDVNLEYFTTSDTLIIYNWNRDYPSDQKLDINFDLYNLVDVFEFTGNSHKNITRYTYKKK